MLRDHVLQALEDVNTLHYKPLWLESKNEKEELILEVFSFGKIKDVPESLRCILTALMWTKLRKLTLLDLFCRHRTLNTVNLQTECEMESALEVEQLAMSLGKWVDISIDQVGGEIHVLRCHESRDVYDGEKKLHLVSGVDSRLTLLQDLRVWKERIEYEL
ncbi:LAME_0E04082g1_1 [Lachancea meyersii CBS 8951]|uniref:LAME_0E04082g1_1 n=1 Tax=Lachancea meyersii CBS 8951 TaxID=1266667 RepID=A0A1G4JGR3_9SACH|nr:LAME_0E04082g1_1 [Lachancea meyersii CBS 8951]